MSVIEKRIQSKVLMGVLGLLAVIVAACSQQPQVPPTSPSPSVAPTPTEVTSDTAAVAVAPIGPSSSMGSASTKPTASGATTSGSGVPPPAEERVATPTPAPPPPPPPPPPRTFTLTAGRSMAVFTANALSTKTSKSGDVFVASLANAIVDGDWVIAKKGAEVGGVVSESDPGGRVKGVASLSVKLKSLQLADGQTVAISTSSYIKEAKSTKKKDAVKIGIGAGVGAAIGAIAGGGKGAAIGAGVGGGGGTAAVMATRGEAAVIPSESQITFKLTAPVNVTKR